MLFSRNVALKLSFALEQTYLGIVTLTVAAELCVIT